MQYLNLLVLVAMCQGLVVLNEHEERGLPTPKLLDLTALDPPALQVEWKLVDKKVAGLGSIKGYKILVWEMQPVKASEYKTINGVDTIEGFKPPKLSDSDTEMLFEEEAKTVVVSDPLVSKAEVPNIKLNSIYQVRVRAFTESKDGPLSDHLTVQLLDNKQYSGKHNV